MPISESNIHDIQCKITNIETYIKSLTVNSQLIVHSTYQTGFIIIVSLHSVVGIFDTWIAPNSSVYYLLIQSIARSP